MAEARAARLPLRATALLCLLIALLVTGGATWAVHVAVSDQEHRLLKERTGEVGLVLTEAVDALPSSLQQQGAVLQATGNSSSAYSKAAAAASAVPSAQPVTYAWLRSNSDGTFTVIAEAGDELTSGELISDARTTALTKALTAKTIVPTQVIGAQRILGFAMGPPVAPAGTVLYRQSMLGPVVSPPRAAGTAPFSELDVALYASTRPASDQILVATTKHLPLSGAAQRQLLAVGRDNWLLTVSPRGALVGSLTANAQWMTLAIGALGSLLVALFVEASGRRRDATLELYRAEHQVAETLQRNLLPTLPSLPGLTLAARYLAGGTGQQVGGDWFDVFPVAGGRVGVVVGDVIGHDVTAASAMAQIRALLRGYAVDGDPPASVITRLDRVVDLLQLTQLVTVFYGLLDLPAADGSRALQYSNAGHVPPILREPSGTVSSLSGAESVVIGAPIDVAHAQDSVQLSAGSVLTLFTDGLVEVPGGSLTDGLRNLEDSVAALGEADVEQMCDALVAGAERRRLRDDVALLIIRLSTPAGAAVETPELTGGDLKGR